MKRQVWNEVRNEVWNHNYLDTNMRREQDFPNCGLLWAIVPFAKLKRYFILCYRSVPTVGYGSRHEIFAGRLLWHVSGGDQGVAKLSSLQRCKCCKCVWVHCNVHNHVQKTMGGHLEKRIREHVIAIFVIIICNRNNTATKMKMKVASHRFVHTCL